MGGAYVEMKKAVCCCDQNYETLLLFKMRINSKQLLFDQPILKIREVIRYAMTERLFVPKKQILINEVAIILEQPKAISKKVFGLLVQEGYLILDKKKKGGTFY